MAPGTRSKFGAPMLEPDFPEVFRKQMYCIEENTCDIVGFSGASGSDSMPGEAFPLAPPRYAPG